MFPSLLVVAEGVELRPAVAIRWTRTHVMICLEDHGGAKVSSDWLWLPAADVVRLLRLPRTWARPAAWWRR
jgi:hypothetical protein